MGFGGFLKGLVGGTSSSASSSALGFASSYYGREHAYGLNKQARIKGPSWDVEGLRRAGLNPVLAARGSGAGFSSSPLSSPASDIARSMESISSSSAKDADAKLKKEQAEATKASKDLMTAQTKQAYQLADESYHRTAKEMFQADSAQAEAYIRNQIKNVYSSKIGSRTLPILRALAESGLRPDLALGAIPSSAGAVAKFLFSKKPNPIGF